MPITAPTLAIVDAEDDTGGTAVITNGDALALNTLYAQTVDGELGGGDWESLGSRTGPGALVFTTAKGYYWFKIQSTSGNDSVVSNLVYQNITDGEDAILEQCLVGIQARIQGLVLEDIPSNHVLALKSFTEKPADIPEGENPYPLVMVMPFGQETEAGGPLSTDDVLYPFLVVLVDADQRDQELNRAKYAKWRQQVLRSFRQQPRLVGVGRVIKITVKPLAILDPAAWFSSPGRWMSSIEIDCLAREPRGVS